MNGSVYLQWHYLIFLAPAAASALLLLLSGLRLGGHRGHHRGGPAVRQGGAGAGRHGQGAGHGRHGTGKAGAVKAKLAASGTQAANGIADFVLLLLGVGRVPVLLLWQMFFLCGGIAGFWANRLLLPEHAEPTLAQWLPSLAIAVVCGAVGSRLMGELIVRILPRDESAAVGREGLYGLTGKVVYPVSATGGRVHLYDDFGTLHDETCRVAPGQATVEKGEFARVVDRDSAGRLIVERAPEPLRLRQEKKV